MLKVKVNKTFPRRPFKLMKGPHWSRYQHFEISCPLLLYLLLALFGLSSGTWSWCHRKVTRSFAQQATTEQILSMDSISKVLLKFRMVRTIKISQYQLYYHIFKITFCFVGFFFFSLLMAKIQGKHIHCQKHEEQTHQVTSGADKWHVICILSLTVEYRHRILCWDINHWGLCHSQEQGYNEGLAYWPLPRKYFFSSWYLTLYPLIYWIVHLLENNTLGMTDQWSILILLEFGVLFY